MQDEQLDDIIREAAERHHPGYNDTAWEQMNSLLDKHLPEKKEKKRPGFFWFALLFLATGTGIALLVTNSGKDNITFNKVKQDSDSKNNNTNKQGSNETADDTAGKTNEAATNNQTTVNGTGPAINTPQSSGTNNTVFLNNHTEKALASFKRKPGFSKTNTKTSLVSGDISTVEETKEEEVLNAINNDRQVTGSKNQTTVASKTDNTIAKKEQQVTSNTVKQELAKEDKKEDKQETATNNTSAKKKSRKSSPLEKLSFTLSAGGDLSYVDLKKPGEGKLLRGAGIQYQIGQRFAVRSGFYVADKIYSAGAYQYHPRENPQYYTNLVKVDANCRVYEIPLSVTYRFAEAKNHGFYTAAGLSSVIMKKEKYNFLYKNAQGVYYTYPRTVSNQYKHLFSNLSLSLGYQYKLSNQVSFSAEPYLSLPLSGIGLGRVKLNSIGVIMSVAVKPFAGKKKK